MIEIEEQKRVTKEFGRLSAWHGQTAAPKFIYLNQELYSAWSEGYDEQCKAMSAAAAKVPLTWPDQMESGARAD